QLQARAPVRCDEPGGPAQARGSERRGRRRLALGADRGGPRRRRVDSDRLPPGREPGAADEIAAGAVRERGAADLDAVARAGAVARRRPLVRRSALPLATRGEADQHRYRNAPDERGGDPGMSANRAPVVSDGAMVAAVGCVVGVGALLWLWGGLAGALFGHGWPPVAGGQLPSVLI